MRHNAAMSIDQPGRALPFALPALAAGGAVYAWGRPASFFAISAPTTFPPWTAALPSLLHTFAFGLLCAAVARRPVAAATLAIGWGVVEAAAEYGQRLGIVPGTFDWMDLIAVALGTALVLTLVPRLTARSGT